MTPGPFHDFSPEQWQTVRETHRRFCVSRDWGRPLFSVRFPEGLSDAPVSEIVNDTIVLAGPAQREPEMDTEIRRWIRSAWSLSRSRRRRDSFPLVFIPRRFYGHSQRLSEPFGTETLVEGDEQAQAFPCLHSFSNVDRLKLKPVKECPWLSRSLEVLRYFVDSTEGRYYIPHFVTTGPCDTVNYATGSTQLLLGFYENPKAVHQLLRMATELIIEHILECRKIAGDRLVSDHTHLLDGCYCICSEIRSQFSAEHYAEFEAPYLKQISDAVGPLHVHVSGPVDQSVPATLANPAIRHLRFWLKDSNLPLVAGLIGDRISIDFFRNDCMPALAFQNPAAFYRHIFENIRPETRWTIPHFEPEAFNAAYDALEREGRLPEQVRRFGHL